MTFEELGQLGFMQSGRIVQNKAGRLIFELNGEFTGTGQSARLLGWVYLWVQVHEKEQAAKVVYVGKAGNTLYTRCNQHQNGFSSQKGAGGAHATRILEYLQADSRQHQMHVYARKSPDVEILGEPSVSTCEVEERAMIVKCLRLGAKLWNYQANIPATGNGRELKAVVPPVTPESTNQDEHGSDVDVGLSSEDAFFALIANQPKAQEAIAGLLNVLAGRDDCVVRYTFTGNADLRVCSTAGRTGKLMVARFWWQPNNGGFASELYLSPTAALDAGATSAREPNSSNPMNVRSQAFFQIPGKEQAIVNVVLESLKACAQDAG